MDFFVLVFLFGLILGSFVNVVVLRFNTGLPIARMRSKCFSCGKTLRWFELIPVLSFLIQQGRCRGCKSKISWQYPLVELALGLLFLLFYIKWQAFYGQIGDISILIWWWMLGFLLVVLSVYDLHHKILPDRFTYSLFIVAFLGSFLFFHIPFKTALLSLLPAAFLFLLWAVSKGKWMGLGDAKLMAGGGIFLGWPNALAALFIAFWTGALFAVVLMAIQRSANLKREIPFGPLLALGVLGAFFFSGVLDSFFVII